MMKEKTEVELLIMAATEAVGKGCSASSASSNEIREKELRYGDHGKIRKVPGKGGRGDDGPGGR